MRLLVTGSTGFLGRHLIPVLESQGHIVDKANSKTILMPARYDYIYHLAAWTQAGDFCLTHSGEQWLINQKINTDMLTYWRDYSPTAKLITIGSSCAYMPGANLLERHYLDGKPHDSVAAYAMSKRMLYEGCRALNKQFGMNYLYLVPSTLYGPNYHMDKRQPHFIFDLIRKIIRGKELGEPVVLWGNGYQKREIIYVDDFVNLMLALNDKVSNDIFNLGAEESYSISYFATQISKIIGYDAAKIIFDHNKYVGAKDKSLCVEKAKTILGSYPVTLLQRGLRKTIDWHYVTGVWQ